MTQSELELEQRFILSCFNHDVIRPFTIHDNALSTVRHDRATHGLPRTFAILRSLVKTRKNVKTVKA